MSVRITGGSAKGRKLPSSSGLRIRPTSERVRGAIYSLLGPNGARGRRVLDLYAGTGALGLEALSRGAAWVDFVEAGARQCRFIDAALKELRFDDRAHVYRGRAERVLRRLEGEYDLILIDPPYEMANLGLILDEIAGGSALRDDGLVVVEHSRRRPLDRSYGKLKALESRVYGDTAVSIYGLKESDD